MGLVMGVYDTHALPIYEYLHSAGHPDYAIEDNFFQGAFGGSFLNHQWLIAATPPVDPTGAPGGANQNRHPTLDSNGMPSNEPLYVSTIPPPVPGDHPLTAKCEQVATLPPPTNTRARPNYPANTMQPAFQPCGTFGAKIPAQTNPTIGDRLSKKHVSWAWYAGGWSNANGDVGAPGWTNGTAPAATPTGCSDPYVDPGVGHWPRCPDNLFQYHHQPFNYFAAFSTETKKGLKNRRKHLRVDAQVQAPEGQLREAVRDGERASRLRERAPRQRPSRRPAQVDRAECVREEHHGHRHVRRVRRPMGSRSSARTRRRSRTSRCLGPGNANPRARLLAEPQGSLRRRQRPARHDVDHCDARAQVQAQAARHTRCCGAGSVLGARGKEAEGRQAAEGAEAEAEEEGEVEPNREWSPPRWAPLSLSQRTTSAAEYLSSSDDQTRNSAPFLPRTIRRKKPRASVRRMPPIQRQYGPRPSCSRYGRLPSCARTCPQSVVSTPRREIWAGGRGKTRAAGFAVPRALKSPLCQPSGSASS